MDLAAVILAAGGGTRLAPLTALRPKALCPVGNVPLLDTAIARTDAVADAIAVNAHHLANQIVEHVAGRALVSVEPTPLGTAGAVGNLLPWIASRPVLTLNADAWHQQDLRPLIEGWSGDNVRLLVVRDVERADFDGTLRFAGAALMPFEAIKHLRPEFTSLHEEVWRPWRAAGRAEFWESHEPFIDCGTPADYHAANMRASASRTVVGAGARVLGTAERCVLWPGVTVAPGEHLVDAIRARDDITITIGQR